MLKLVQLLVTAVFVTADYTYVGCFNEKDTRALSGPSTFFPNMTVEACAESCVDFKYFAVEYSEQCYCGNSGYDIYGSSESCDMPCGGDNSQMCGGWWTMSVYEHQNGCLQADGYEVREDFEEYGGECNSQSTFDNCLSACNGDQTCSAFDFSDGLCCLWTPPPEHLTPVPRACTYLKLQGSSYCDIEITGMKDFNTDINDIYYYIGTDNNDRPYYEGDSLSIYYHEYHSKWYLGKNIGSNSNLKGIADSTADSPESQNWELYGKNGWEVFYDVSIGCSGSNYEPIYYAFCNSVIQISGREGDYDYINGYYSFIGYNSDGHPYYKKDYDDKMYLYHIDDFGTWNIGKDLDSVNQFDAYIVDESNAVWQVKDSYGGTYHLDSKISGDCIPAVNPNTNPNCPATAQEFQAKFQALGSCSSSNEIECYYGTEWCDCSQTVINLMHYTCSPDGIGEEGTGCGTCYGGRSYVEVAGIATAGILTFGIVIVFAISYKRSEYNRVITITEQ